MSVAAQAVLRDHEGELSGEQDELVGSYGEPFSEPEIGRP